MDITNHSFLITKPWKPIDESTELKIIHTLEEHLGKTGGYQRIILPHRLRNVSSKFWRDFYSNSQGWSGFKWMIEDFSWMRDPLIVYYSGEKITERIVDALGPTKYIDNYGILTSIGDGTIRKVYGMPWGWGWRNVAHAPKPKEVEPQLRILEKYRMI